MINRTLKTCTTKEKSWNVWNEKYAKAFDLTTKTGPEKKWYVMKEKSFLHHKSCISKEKYFLTVCHTFYMTPKIQTVFHRFKKSYYLWPFHTGIYRHFVFTENTFFIKIKATSLKCELSLKAINIISEPNLKQRSTFYVSLSI